jgi:hypothetical protein
VKGVCMYYIAKGVLVVVMPIVFSLNMGGLPGGVDGRHESACQFLKACPTFDNQREMWETMRDPAKCEEAGGIHLEVPESQNDHSMGDTEIWFSIRCLTIVFAAIGAGLNLRSMMSGSNAYLAPLVRGLIVLCLCEMFAEVFAHMSIDDMCSGKPAARPARWLSSFRPLPDDFPRADIRVSLARCVVPCVLLSWWIAAWCRLLIVASVRRYRAPGPAMRDGVRDQRSKHR